MHKHLQSHGCLWKTAAAGNANYTFNFNGKEKMADLKYYQYAYMSDNYGVLIHSPTSGETAAVDCGDAAAALAACEENNWSLSHIFATHHHADHTAGLAALKEKTGCKVIGPAGISGVDNTVADGDSFEFAGVTVNTIHTPGHTKDMINYYLPTEKTVFTGDTLFSLGCGRVFEGDANMMWNSLSKLMQLPADTTIYSSHEYTEANAAFAVTVDPQNAALQKRVEHIKTLRSQGKATVPSLLSEELETNPFLRAGDSAIRKHLNMADASDAEVFAEIRTRKDNF